MFEIERDVPIPPRRVSQKATKYPWRTMAVGDSFFVPGKTSVKFSGATRYGAKITGFKFTTRTVEGGCRVWRIE